MLPQTSKKWRITKINKEIIYELDEADRLDSYLAKKLNSKRSLIQHNILVGNILVNEHISKAATKLKKGDIILVKDLINPDVKALLKEKIPLDIIYEDDDLIIINKTRHLVTHPGINNYEHTLVNALLGANKVLAENKNRPGIVHRLDKDTSGLLVVAKNSQALTFLSSLLSDHQIVRKYLALVKGVIHEQEGKIIAPIGKDKKHPLKQAVDLKNGKYAETDFKVIKTFQNKYSLVDVRLKTGRTHQIRVHFDYIGHPLIGDLTYGKDNLDLVKDGQLLHAYHLELIHPRLKQKMAFDAPLPAYFQEILDQIS